MFIVSELGLRGLFSSRTSVEHHTHPTLETPALRISNIHDICDHTSVLFMNCL
jgi:hypothetical protein